MTKWAGLLLIGAGVAGALVVYPMLDDAPKGAASTNQATLPPPVQRPPVVLVPAPEAPRPVAGTEPPARPQPVVQPRVAAFADPGAALLPRPVEAAQPMAPRVPRGDDGRQVQARELARDIQRELRRVGCYRGEVDGVWSLDTQQSMRAFIERVNATLPIDQPDHILKTLVQGHPGSACGQSCPSGQTLGADGRCLPGAVVAQVPRKAPPKEVAVAATGAPTAGPAPAPTRGWEPSVSAASKSAPSTSAQPATTAVAPPAPLPGRMAIGAPVAAEPVPQPVAPPTIVLRPKVRPADQPPPVAAAGTAVAAADAAAAAREPIPRPVVGAIKAAEQQDPADGSAGPARRQFAGAGVPPPRYVGAAPRPQPSYVRPAPRPRFGPGIFREMERNAR